VSAQLRQTGIGAVGDVPWGTHFFLFQETKEDLLDALVPYFKVGLENRELCIWVISDPLTEEEVRHALRQSIPDVEKYVQDESMQIVKGREWYMSGDDLDLGKVARVWNDKLEGGLARGYCGLRLSGDTAWLESKHWKKFCEYENEINHFMTDKPTLALCTYPLRRSSAAEILDVTRTHQFAVARRNKQWEIVETSELKKAKTEIQKLNDELEQRVAERTRELLIANEELRREMNERQRAEDALMVAQAQLNASFNNLRALNARLQSVREEERKRVAREIHDELGQALTAIKIDLTSLFRALSADQTSESAKSESILRLVDQTIQSVRRIATELRPGILDDLGLVAAVEWAAEEFAARSGTTLRLDLPEEDLVIDRESATAIFRILQETLTNVSRHAEATQVEVRIGKEGGGFILEVRDNGKGISEEQLSAGTSLGILGLRERVLLLGGALTIRGTPGKGTTVRVLIPDSGRWAFIGDP
jgi:signal transduction histidine kinase